MASGSRPPSLQGFRPSRASVGSQRAAQMTLAFTVIKLTARKTWRKYTIDGLCLKAGSLEQMTASSPPAFSVWLLSGSRVGRPRSPLKAGSLAKMTASSPPAFSVRLLSGPRVGLQLSSLKAGSLAKMTSSSPPAFSVRLLSGKRVGLRRSSLKAGSLEGMTASSRNQ